MTPTVIPATALTPGMQVHRWDSGELLYTVEAATAERRDWQGRPTDLIRADCRHADGRLLPHYWLPGDRVIVNPREDGR